MPKDARLSVSLPEPVAQALDARGYAGAPSSAAASLFWERDLREWEKMACLKLMDMGEPLMAEQLAETGLDFFGVGAKAAGAREALRASQAIGYFGAAHAKGRQEEPMGAGLAWLGARALFANALLFSPHGAMGRKLLCLAALGAIVAAPCATLALPLSGLALASCFAGACCASAASLWGVGRSALDSQEALGGILALPFLSRTLAGGVLVRAHQSLAHPRRLSPLIQLRKLYGDEAGLSAALRAEAPLGRDPKPDAGSKLPKMRWRL